MSILQIDRVNTFYNLSHILFDISLRIQKEMVTGLLGRNGAGKTTTLKTIMGLVPPKTGSIYFNGKDIARFSAYKVAHEGITFVPDNRQIFPTLSVYENLIIAIPKEKRKGNSRWTLDRVYELFPVLGKTSSKRGTHLSGGEQKMLAIGRALMRDPSLLLLDEPTEGLSPLVVKAIGETILKIKQEGVTLLIADQNVNFARKLIVYAYVIDKGRIQHEAPMEDFWRDEELVHKYLAV